jgi:hypothetical protein
MKNIFLITVITAVTLGSVCAQEIDARQKLYLGLKAGYNISNIYDAEGGSLDTKTKLGFAGGLFVTIPLNRFVGIQPEILFSQRGFRGTGVLLGNSYDLARTSSYIDLPLLLALKPNQFVTILGGPQISYLVKQKDVFTDSPSSIQQEEEFNNDNIRRNMLCLLGGVDLNFHPAVIGFRTGFDLQQNNGDGTSTTPRYKNIWVQVSFGFRL